MGLLLHISDLHLGKNRAEESARIRSLANAIITEGLSIKHVVFTGDVIDANVVIRLTLDKLVNEIPDFFIGIDVSKLSEKKVFANALKMVEMADSAVVEKYNKYLRESAVECAKNAASEIREFLESIKVEKRRFISCCGNHDRLRFLGLDNVVDCGLDKRVDEKTLKEEYLPYNVFCKEVNANLDYRTQRYICDDVCYVIANSNWKVPKNRETNNACINCAELSDVLCTVEKANDYRKNSTIFLSHKPFDDICENAKYIYGQNENYITVKERINRVTSMSLHGDKHSYIANVQQDYSTFMCGFPLQEDDVHYNLINYSEGGMSSVRFISYKNDRWILTPTVDCIGEVYDLCKDYIKEIALQLLCKKKEIPKRWEMLFRLVDESFENGRFGEIRNLFRECTTLYDSKQNKLPYRDDNNIFEDILQLVNRSDERRVLGLKGEPRTGKSTFLSIQYIYMLRQFYAGNTPYIPFYFDLDILTKQMEESVERVSDIQKKIEWYCDKFNDFLKQVIEIGAKHNLAPCIIIDGLDTDNMLTYTGHTIEYYYYKMLEEKIRPVAGKYIMGLNTHLNSLFEKSFDQVNKFEYACFMNKVFIVPYKKREHHKKFMDAYLKLARDLVADEIEVFYSSLKKLRRISVDLDYVYTLDELIRVGDLESDSWKVMKRKLEFMTKRIDEDFGEAHKEVLYKAAYLIYFRGNTYQLILNDKDMKELTYIDFLKIRNNPEVAKFLIARHYIQELKYYASCEKSIDEESILNCFISRDISVTIRLLIEDLGIQAQVFKNVVNMHSENLQGYFISFLIYLLGHNKNYNGLRAVKIEKLKLSDENKFLANCIIRSYELAEIVSADDEMQRKKSNDFLKKLMTDEKFRMFNRVYQLWYYEDIEDALDGKSGIQEKTRKIKKGFDFHNCFMFLVSKIDYCFDHNEPYPLLEIDVFTLCDLIYSRLQKFNSEGIFYSAVYNDKENSISASILKRVIDIVDIYLKRYSQSRNLSNNIEVYFETTKNIFEKSFEEINKRKGMEIKEPLVSQASDYAKVLQLCEMPRVGWNITKNDLIYKKEMPRYECITKDRKPKEEGNCPVFETIGQHILESIYIAELFLPDQIPEDGYEKSTVISMILMSEVGKIAVTHDYTPEFYRASTFLMSQECSGRKQFLIQGAFDGYADLMKLYDAMLIVGGKLGAYSDINMRICQEIKLIQMEYKFYSLKEELDFDVERESDFKKDFADLITPICKDIRKMLITNNVFLGKKI